MKLSTRQVIDMFGISRARLHQLRCGYSNTYKRNEKKYTNFIKPKLIEDKDWYFERGNIYFNKSAINKLEKIIKKP